MLGDVNADAPVLAVEQELDAAQAALELADPGDGADGVQRLRRDVVGVGTLGDREDQLVRAWPGRLRSREAWPGDRRRSAPSLRGRAPLRGGEGREVSDVRSWRPPKASTVPHGARRAFRLKPYALALRMVLPCAQTEARRSCQFGCSGATWPAKVALRGGMTQIFPFVCGSSAQGGRPRAASSDPAG